MSEPRSVDTVLFALHNTTMDGNYARVGMEHSARIMATQWGVDVDAAVAAFMPSFARVMHRYAERDFYLMREVFVDAFRGVAHDLGLDLTEDDLRELDREMWVAGCEAALPVDGTIETFDRLREAGVKVGIVSWADAGIFDALMERLASPTTSTSACARRRRAAASRILASSAGRSTRSTRSRPRRCSSATTSTATSSVATGSG